MSSFSSVTIMGNLTKDPELRYTPNGKAVLDITLGVNRGSGEHKKAIFIDCTLWGKTAETVADFFSKGKPIIVHGELDQDQWEDRETGAKRSKVKVTGRSFTFLPRNGGDSDNSSRGSSRKSRQEDTAPQAAQPKEEDLDDFGGQDEVPF